MENVFLTAANSINARVDTINTLSTLVYIDAEQHGLYDIYEGMTRAQQRRKLALRIMEEAAELFAAADDEDHYQEELADCVIMPASVAGFLGYNLGEIVERKRLINIDRPHGHK